MLDISVIVPLYNEDESLPELFSWIKRVMEAGGFSYEVIFVNDGSTDRSQEVIEELNAAYPDHVRGIKFRRTQADQMRFKVMHKIYDFEKRFGYPMCVGCGRCDDVCPEYISYSNLVNRLAKEEEES